MTRPTEVTVQVADLEAVVKWCERCERNMTFDVNLIDAKDRLRAAIPEPEWEPTDDMRDKYRRAFGVKQRLHVDQDLRLMHREGLL